MCPQPQEKGDSGEDFQRMRKRQNNMSLREETISVANKSVPVCVGKIRECLKTYLLIMVRPTNYKTGGRMPEKKHESFA